MKVQITWSRRKNDESQSLASFPSAPHSRLLLLHSPATATRNEGCSRRRLMIYMLWAHCWKSENQSTKTRIMSLEGARMLSGSNYSIKGKGWWGWTVLLPLHTVSSSLVHYSVTIMYSPKRKFRRQPRFTEAASHVKRTVGELEFKFTWKITWRASLKSSEGSGCHRLFKIFVFTFLK